MNSRSSSLSSAHAHVGVRRERLERAAPEDAADQGGVLERPLVEGVEPVDARGDQRLDGVGDALERAALLVGEHARRLLEEERVALGLLERERALRRRDVGVREQRVDQLAALLRRSASRARARARAGCRRPRSAAARAGPAAPRRRSSTGASRSARPRCSITSSSGSSAHCTSSKTSTSGCACASCSAQSVTAHVSSPAVRPSPAAPSTPSATASRSATASLSQQRRSFSNASDGRPRRRRSRPRP